MVDPVALEKAAIALANQTVMRNGSPPISNVLDLMSAQTRSSFTGDATACIEAYLEVAKPAAGWKLVPIEPTPEMMRQGADYLPVTPGGATNRTAGNVYEAMLAAAPEPTP